MFLSSHTTSALKPNRLCFLNLESVQTAVNRGAERAKLRALNPEEEEPQSLRERLGMPELEPAEDGRKKVYALLFGDKESLH